MNQTTTSGIVTECDRKANPVHNNAVYLPARNGFRLWGPLLLILCLCFNLGPTARADDSEITPLLDEFLLSYISFHPEEITQLGLSSFLEKTIARNVLDDKSDARLTQEFDVMHKFRVRLDAFDTSTFDPCTNVDAAVLREYLGLVADLEKFRYHPFLVDHIAGDHNSFITLMTGYQPMNSVRDARDYIRRLERFPVKLAQLQEAIKTRQARGFLAPKLVLKRTSDAFRDLIEGPPEKHILFTVYKMKIRTIKGLDRSTRKQLKNQVIKIIREEVYPAISSYVTFLEQLLQQAKNYAGVWNLPDGDAYYRYCLRLHTTTSLSPEEIHNLGLGETSRIQSIILERLETLGIKRGETFSKTMRDYWAYLRRHGLRYAYPTDGTGRQRVLNDYRLIINRAKSKLESLFNEIPQSPVTVEAVPAYQEKTAGTYFSPAPLDGSRQGVFFANLSYLPMKPGMETLTFHETIPGHHLQLAIQRESPSLHTYRHVLWFTAHGEGWALYAERLALDNKWFSSTFSEIGYYQSELFRAVRLVLDTGLHYKRWTREQALEYMHDNLGWNSVNEIDRYTIWPGQACAYKIGELKILELRELARKELALDFDIKSFHSCILECGSVPLDILEQLVRDYIKETKRNNATHRGDNDGTTD